MKCVLVVLSIFVHSHLLLKALSEESVLEVLVCEFVCLVVG